MAIVRKKDKLGRSLCYDDTTGHRVPCDDAPAPSAQQSPPQSSREPFRLPAGDKRAMEKWAEETFGDWMTELRNRPAVTLGVGGVYRTPIRTTPLEVMATYAGGAKGWGMYETINGVARGRIKGTETEKSGSR